VPKLLGQRGEAALRLVHFFSLAFNQVFLYPTEANPDFMGHVVLLVSRTLILCSGEDILDSIAYTCNIPASKLAELRVWGSMCPPINHSSEIEVNALIQSSVRGTSMIPCC
jgi:hypothetical protein